MLDITEVPGYLAVVLGLVSLLLVSGAWYVGVCGGYHLSARRPEKLYSATAVAALLALVMTLAAQGLAHLHWTGGLLFLFTAGSIGFMLGCMGQEWEATKSIHQTQPTLLINLVLLGLCFGTAMTEAVHAMLLGREQTLGERIPTVVATLQLFIVFGNGLFAYAIWYAVNRAPQQQPASPVDTTAGEPGSQS